MKFVNFETAKALKELGFVEPCFGFYFPSGKFSHVHSQWRGSIAEDCTCNYNKLDKDVYGNENIDAPTLEQAADFLRSIKTLHTYAIQMSPGVWIAKVESTICDVQWTQENETHFNYYEAFGSGLMLAIQILKTTDYGK